MYEPESKRAVNLLVRTSDYICLLGLLREGDPNAKRTLPPSPVTSVNE